MTQAGGYAPHNDIVVGVALPLRNLEYTIHQYLLDNGTWLDTETRVLLAGVRDCLSQVAGTTQSAAGYRA